MKSKKITALFLIVAIVSFLGYWVENLWLLFTLGYMDNRNMRLPFLLGYGLAIVAIYMVFGTPQHPRFLHIPIGIKSPFLRTSAYYLIACLCVMLGEIALGTLVEYTCGIVWWDYTNLPLHITRYTSIPTTLAFAALITVFMGCIFTPLYTWFSQNANQALLIVSSVLMCVMTVDLILSAIQMYTSGQFTSLWHVDCPNNPIYKLFRSLTGNP